MNDTQTKVILTVAGNTYPSRSFLKEEGFTWDSESKSWSMECKETEDGKLDGPHFLNSSRKAYEHRIACYTKRQVTCKWSS